MLSLSLIVMARHGGRERRVSAIRDGCVWIVGVFWCSVSMVMGYCTGSLWCGNMWYICKHQGYTNPFRILTNTSHRVLLLMCLLLFFPGAVLVPAWWCIICLSCTLYLPVIFTYIFVLFFELNFHRIPLDLFECKLLFKFMIASLVSY